MQIEKLIQDAEDTRREVEAFIARCNEIKAAADQLVRQYERDAANMREFVREYQSNQKAFQSLRTEAMQGMERRFTPDRTDFDSNRPR